LEELYTILILRAFEGLKYAGIFDEILSYTMQKYMSETITYACFEYKEDIQYSAY